MGTASVHNVGIAGIAACVPRHVANNHDNPYLSAEEREKTIRTTGIEYRRVASSEQCTSDLCAKAAEGLLQELDWSAGEIDALVFVSQTADYPLPATAPLLQHRLGMPKSCLALDINLGCSGYTYGLQVLSSLLSAGGLKRGLLLVGDTSTKIISPTDRSVATLFGDAGSATALEHRPGAVMHFDFGTDGGGFEAIIIPDGGQRSPVSDRSLVVAQLEEGIARNRCQLALDGVEVFNFSIREVPRTVRNVLSLAGKQAEEIDAFVFHQANRFMNELIGKKLKVAPERIPSTLRDFGNTSSASIPLTIVARLRPAITETRMTLVLSGFGVGLSWSTAFIETDRISCPAVMEI